MATYIVLMNFTKPPGPGHFLGTSETPHGMTLALEGRSPSDQTVAAHAE
jgi:hypothetical protein